MLLRSETVEAFQSIVIRFLSVPLLPSSQVSLVAAAKNAAPALEKLGIRVLSPAPCLTLPEETKEHTDMLLCHAGGDVVFISADQPALAQTLRNEGFTVRLVPPPGADYPTDVPLNVLILRDAVIGNLRHTDKTLLSHFEQNGKRQIRVKQGYAKCSVCLVTENAAITDDAGMANALRELGQDVLLISKGDIYLSDRHYGLIGGTAGKLAPDILAFFGSLQHHRDGDLIRAFLSNYGVRPVELFQGRLTDIGGILPLMEKENGKSRH